MERQTKHRILGIFVIIGLVIILLPLFQSNKELSTEAALVQAPPFPDQPVRVATSMTEPEAAAINPQQPNQLDDVINTAHHPKAAKSDLSIVPTLSSTEPLKTVANYRVIEDNEKPAPHKLKAHTLVAAIKAPMKALMRAPETDTIDDDGLLKLKSAVWVIQIGSFKNKANALRMVNQLRSNGYKAFIQTALGDNTRVFVGPEHKRTTARELADRLQSEMHIQGLVISYKPLAL